jgi:hypothetical protein
VDDLAMLIQILPSGRRNSQVAVASIITFEESQGIATGDDASTLVVEERGRVAFEEGDVVRVRCRKTFQSEGCRKATQGGSSLSICQSMLHLQSARVF